MKRIVYYVIILFVLIGCQNMPNNSGLDGSASDSLDIYGRSDTEVRDSLKKVLEARLNDNIFGDTVGVYKSPIKVLKSRMVQEEYSNFRDVELTFKNVSNKRITGVKFKWKGVNAFGELADMGGVYDGYGSGFTDDVINAGRTKTYQWSVLSRDGKKILYAWAYEVAFEDGTSWKLGD